MKRHTNRTHKKVNANTQASAPAELTEDQLEQVAGGAVQLPAVQSTVKEVKIDFLKLS
jgi:hypothetical protein